MSKPQMSGSCHRSFYGGSGRKDIGVHRNVIRKVADLDTWQLWPKSRSRPWPDYIPESVRSSYEQACYCEVQAPAASATMARRALHEMLKDFCGVKGSNLRQDIDSLTKKGKRR